MASPAIDRERVRRAGFTAFVRCAWDQVEPRSCIWSWHLDAICTELEAFASRRGRMDLVIELPPGMSKSTIVSVLFPAWVWIKDPTHRFICASYDRGLMLRDARRTRSLVQGEWFRARWPEVEIPRHDDDIPGGASYYATSRGGGRYSTTVRGAVTGHHAHTHLIDDPLDPHGAEAASGSELDLVAAWYDRTMSSRFVDQTTAGTVLIAQRLHERDLTGHLVAHTAAQRPDALRVLCLPMRYERDHPHRYAADPRSTEGELLCPARFPDDVVRVLESKLGMAGVAAQFQQRPAPPGGEVFRREWLQKYWIDLPKKGQWLLSLDAAFKDKASSDHVSLGAWLYDAPDVYLVDNDTGVKDFTATCAALKAMAARYPQAVTKLIEAKANGIAVANVFERTMSGIVLVEPEGGKLARANACTGWWHAGNVWLPDPVLARYPGGRRGASWVRRYQDAMQSFPRARYDDEVDMTTQLLNHLAGGQSLVLEAMRHIGI